MSEIEKAISQAAQVEVEEDTNLNSLGMMHHMMGNMWKNKGFVREDKYLACIAAVAARMVEANGGSDPWGQMRREYERALGKHGRNRVLTNPHMSFAMKYYAIAEEIGEVSRCLTYDKEHAGDLVEETVQVGGLALAWAQAIINEKGE